MHKGTIEAYDRDAEYWAQTRTTDAESPQVAKIRELRERVGAGVVLDLGCGPGKMFDVVGAPLVGMDASSSMLRLARRIRWTPLVQGDLERLPFRSASAGGVLGNFCYQHLPRDRFSHAIAEVARVLAVGGVVQIAVQAGEFDGDDRPDDDIGGRWFSYWEEGPLRAQLERASLRVVDLHRGPTSLRATARKDR